MAEKQKNAVTVCATNPQTRNFIPSAKKSPKSTKFQNLEILKILTMIVEWYAVTFTKLSVEMNCDYTSNNRCSVRSDQFPAADSSDMNHECTIFQSLVNEGKYVKVSTYDHNLHALMC